MKSQPKSFGALSAHSVRSGILPREYIATIASKLPTEPMSCLASDCFLRRLMVVPLSWAQLGARRGGRTSLEGGRGKREHGGREGRYMSSVISSCQEVGGGGRRVGWVLFFSFWVRGDETIIYSILFIIYSYSGSSIYSCFLHGGVAIKFSCTNGW